MNQDQGADKEKKLAEHDYNKTWSEVYGDMQEKGPAHRHLHRILKNRLETVDYQSVIDVGCGPGHNFSFLTKNKQDIKFAGIDISSEAINKAITNNRGDFFVLDIQKDFPKTKQWDMVFCSMVLEHLPDDVSALKNMREMTSKYILIATMAGDFDRYRKWDELVGHVRNYKKGELEEKMLKAGFRNIQSVYWGFPFYTPIGRTLQNFSKMGTGKFNLLTNIFANILNGLYYLNSSKKGDLVIVLAEV